MANSVINPSLINNTSLSAVFGCWEQNPSHEPQLTPIIYAECKKAIQDIPMGSKALAPVSVGRDTDAGFTLPSTWDYRNCAIEIDVLREDDSDRSTFAAIFKRAWDIARHCVIQPPHLGGNGLVGENGQLTVMMYGVSSPRLAESNLSVSVDTS